MKPTKNSAEILITEDPNYPEGLYAFVDYDYDPHKPSKYRKLKWICEDAHWQALLNSTLSMLIPYMSLHHYTIEHPNPPRHAALVAEETFGVKILSEGITRRNGVVGPDEVDDDDDDYPYIEDVVENEDE